MEQTKWIDRKFDFSFPDGLFPVIIERLRGTPAGLEMMLKGINHEVLTKKQGTGWSIQEHAGHLLDMDELHEKRVDQYIANIKTLIPADMTNRKTYEADYNSENIKDILKQFSEARDALVRKAEGLDDFMVNRTAIHPRLKQEMRLVDMLFFTAEHDDHHLAVMRRLINLFS